MMATATKREANAARAERLAAAILHAGGEELESRAKRWRTFIHGRPGYKGRTRSVILWLGPQGELRQGPSCGSSYAVPNLAAELLQGLEASDDPGR